MSNTKLHDLVEAKFRTDHGNGDPKSDIAGMTLLQLCRRNNVDFCAAEDYYQQLLQRKAKVQNADDEGTAVESIIAMRNATLI